MGLTTDKNFVVSNAVDTILAPPKRVSKEDVQMTQKRGYGAPPPYLRRIKAEMSKEHARKAGESGEGAQSGTLDASMRLLTEAERKRLIAGLRQRWERSNQSYQSLTFSMDTVTKVSRKEMQESELETLEKAINKLSSKYGRFCCASSVHPPLEQDFFYANTIQSCSQEVRVRVRRHRRWV
eukprot:Rhum_TRINITY_DN11731_c0_g1::Rhum_TRINITY_DN11731_c0_g1_i4::g.46559::m.46559